MHYNNSKINVFNDILMSSCCMQYHSKNNSDSIDPRKLKLVKFKYE